MDGNIQPSRIEEPKPVQATRKTSDNNLLFFTILMALLIALTFAAKILSEQYFVYLTAFFVFIFFVLPWLLAFKREVAFVKYKPIDFREVADLERQFCDVPHIGKVKIEKITREKKYGARAHSPYVYYFSGKHIRADGVVEPIMGDMSAFVTSKRRVLGSVEPNVMRVENKKNDWSGDLKHPYGVQEREPFVLIKREAEPVLPNTKKEEKPDEDEEGEE